VIKNSKRTAGVNVRRVKFRSRADLLIHLHELNKLNKLNKKKKK